jgi:hypothetical protein
MLFKRLTAWLIVFIIVLLGISEVSKMDLLEYDRYSLQTYMFPVWEGDTVYNETVMFVRNKDGSLDPAPMLYHADEILSVRSYDLKTEYVQGVDYNLVDGCIVLTENSSIYSWAYDEYYPPEYEEGTCFEREGGGFIFFQESPKISMSQVAVTYRHSDPWYGIVPENQAEKLPSVTQKLKNNEPVSILFYGDSITVGCSASSLLRIEPDAPIWPVMIVEKLRDYYGNDNIEYINTAVGGTASGWGLENVDERVNAYNPDLVVLAFGANDVRTTPLKYSNNIKKIINSCRDKNPDVEFILVSPQHTNKEVRGFYGNQYSFEEMLTLLSLNTEGTAVAPVWSVHTNILNHKRYYDTSANNVNHVNDFMSRVYAQTVSALLVE